MSAPLGEPALVFHRFVVGPGNRLAAEAARSAAEAPGTSYNPLVVVGPPGSGKTHLLGATGHLARTVQPGIRARELSAEALLDRFSAGLVAGTVEQLRAELSDSELFLLDDLQGLAGSPRTQQELLALCERLLERACQVVVSVDRMPERVEGLLPALVDWLGGGLVVDLGAAEEPVRRAILRQQLAESGRLLPAELLDAVARLPIPSVRELQGALARVVEAAGERGLEPAAVPALLGFAPESEDEYGAFLSDISTALAAVVEAAPWRRRLASAILRWEAEGIRTRRLEAALDADSAPDLEALLAAFARDVERLREIGRQLVPPPADPLLLRDPDRLPEAESALLARRPPGAPPAWDAAPAADAGGARPNGSGAAGTADPWFVDREKVALDWIGLEDRILEEPV